MNKAFLLAGLLTFSLLGCKPPTQTPETRSAPHRQSSNREPAAASQPFDFYLLNLSWSPEFCHSHPNARECDLHAAFVLHGFWPQNNDGTYPQQCTDAPGPANPAAYSDIYPDAGLLEHEWRTHGTCSGLSPDSFFTLARTASHSVAIPPSLAQLDHQISLALAEILQLFTQANPNLSTSSLALRCGNNYLTAIEVCLDRSAHPIACGPIRSCRANAVRITPP
ncbi:MAG: ribonuclease T [Acidobacteriota bacterium]|nr:ribonuclease T [Acidobacteriota bacterium]